MRNAARAAAVALLFAVPFVAAAQDEKEQKTKDKPAATTASKAEKAEGAAQAELKIGTAVEKKEIVGAAESFKIAPDTKLFAWAKVSGLPADSKVTLVFSRGDKDAFKKELTIGGASWRFHAYKTFRAGDAGDWTAKLLLGDGGELASAKFTVEMEK